MRWFLFILILLTATLLGAGNLLNVFMISDRFIRPSILITLLVFYALNNPTRQAIICSFLIGFAADLTTGSTGMMGPHTICYGTLGLLVNQANQVILARRAMYQAMIVFAVYFVGETFASWLALLRNQEMPSGYYAIMLFTGLCSAILAPVIWSILTMVSGWTKDKQSYSNRIYRR